MLDRHQFTVFAIAAVLVALGGTALPVTDQNPPEDPDPNQLVTELSAEGPSSFEGRLNTTVAENGTVVERTIYDVVDGPNETERRVAITTDDGRKITLVRNESTAWSYEESADTFSRHDVSDGSPGFIVPALRQDYYEDLTERFDPNYAGTERVGGREAYVLVFTDPKAEDGTASIDLFVGDQQYRLAERRFDEPLVLSEYRLWIDREHAHPLKERTTLTGPGGDSVVFTNRYEWIEFETDPDAETFVFDPPPEAEREAWTPDIETETYESIESADAAVSYVVPNPTAPAGYTLEEIRVTRLSSGERISIRYENGDGRFVVSVWPDLDQPMQGTSVDVDGQRGVVTDRNGEASIHWECTDRRYMIRGPQSVEKLLPVAESIDCRTTAST